MRHNRCQQLTHGTDLLDSSVCGGKSRQEPVFSFLGGIMQSVARTRVYVDGYNLYYGCLKGSPYKWLDPLRLVEAVLQTVLVRDERHDVVKAELLPCALLYFTAPILEKVAKADDSVASQTNYHNALEKTYPERLKLIKGYYALTKAKAYIVDAEQPDRWPRDCSRIQVWKIE
jgi:6-hydroxy-3-succinoylpyridine 3-monooxygenase